MNTPEHIAAISDIEITEKIREDLSYFLPGMKDSKHGAVPQPVGVVRDLIMAVRERLGIFEDV